MKLRSIHTLFFILFFLLHVTAKAQTGGTSVRKVPPVTRDYRKDFISLYGAVQRQFYDSVSGFYRDFEEPAPKNGYAYCWPLCGLLQAYNEAEAAGIGGGGSVEKITGLIDKYKSDKPPMSGYGKQIPGDGKGVPGQGQQLPGDDNQPVPGYDSYLVQFGGGSRFYDDNQWLGLAWMDAWQRKREPALLERGKLIYRFMMTGYDTATGGGLYWEEGKMATKNTCSNGPGIVLALQLYKATREKKYLDTALLLYHWVNEHLRDSDGLYFDNIRVRDRRIGRAKYSYNTGTMLQANVELYELTGEREYLQRAVAIADSACSYFYGSGKFRDGYWFNAVLLRGYQDLLRFYDHPAYLEAFKKCVDGSLESDLSPTGVMGVKKQQLLVNQAGMLEILARLALYR